MKSFFVSISMMLVCLVAQGQKSDSISKKTTIGFEVDALPYIAGGYYGSVWMGQKHIRYRAIVTHITTPGFLVKEGFTNNEIQAYAAIVDYFLKPEFKKWWVGAGLEYWKGGIQADTQLSTAKYNNTVFTLGTGYVWKFYRNFYLNPWAALHVTVAGTDTVTVDDREFKPSDITPEASLKIGWHF